MTCTVRPHHHNESMTPLQILLNTYRTSAASEREKGTYFEELIVCYLRNEATYRDLYSDVWTYSEWARLQGLDGRDTGIDLVAKTQGTGEIHAIQCKLYAEDYRLQKGDIDSFFTASGKKPFAHRVIVSTTNHWSEHAEDALRDQQPPVSKIDLYDLENSQIDWSRYALRKNLRRVPSAMKAEERPVLNDMAEASRSAAARLEISDEVRRTAVRVALGRVTETERHTELTTQTVTTVDAAVVIDRAGLAHEARTLLGRLPQVEDADSKIIVTVLASRLESDIREEHAHEESPPEDQELRRQARDAAYWVIRKCYSDLEEALHAAIAARARYVDAEPLPDLLIYPDQQLLEPSPKNLYGVLPPAKDSFNQLAQQVPIDVRDRLEAATVTVGDSVVRLAPYDGGHVLGHEERSFARALDLAPFVHWWHRNPDRKPYSARLVRGEHRNYFYPDFVVCLDHYPGDESLIRLVETKESTKDAARKARHASTLYGRVLFLTKDMSRLTPVCSWAMK